MKIYIVAEIEGPCILAAFHDIEDAKCFLYHGEYEGKIHRGYFTIREVEVK